MISDIDRSLGSRYFNGFTGVKLNVSTDVLTHISLFFFRSG